MANFELDDDAREIHGYIVEKYRFMLAIRGM
jgi:hypothetical protein